MNENKYKKILKELKSLKIIIEDKDRELEALKTQKNNLDRKCRTYGPTSAGVYDRTLISWNTDLYWRYGGISYKRNISIQGDGGISGYFSFFTN